ERAEHDDPERDRRDDQRGDAGWDRALGEDDQTVPAGQEEQTDRRRAEELARRRAERNAPEPEPEADEHARGQKAKAGAQEGWQRLDRDGDREIRRPPDEVDRAEGGPERDGRRPDRKSTRLNSSHVKISYAVFC